MLNYYLCTQGVSSQPLWLPQCDKPRTGAPSLSSVQGMGEQGPMSPPSSYLHPEFHTIGKGTMFACIRDSCAFYRAKKYQKKRKNQDPLLTSFLHGVLPSLQALDVRVYVQC